MENGRIQISPFPVFHERNPEVVSHRQLFELPRDSIGVNNLNHISALHQVNLGYDGSIAFLFEIPTT